MEIGKNANLATAREGAVAGPAGNLPGTERSGLLLRERVTVERWTAGVWSVVATEVPACLLPVRASLRIALEAVTHRPLRGLWVPSALALRDGYRVTAADGTRWRVRGDPAACLSHVVALVEGEADDGMFAPPQ